MQEVFFYFDDSGVLHKSNDVQKFIYAGYVFQSKKEMERAKRRYKALVKCIQKELDRVDELKSYGLPKNHKRALYNVMRKEESLAAVIDISRVYDHILSTTKSICRYKDYVLKLTIKAKMRCLLDQQSVFPNEDIRLHIFIDEQLTATDGIYGLAESIKEEFQHGISNYNYGMFHSPLFHKNVFVDVQYCESKNNYMIQACDILANRIFTSYRDGVPERRRIPNHVTLTFP